VFVKISLGEEFSQPGLHNECVLWVMVALYADICAETARIEHTVYCSICVDIVLFIGYFFSVGPMICVS
jgi:hypothetical protein